MTIKNIFTLVCVLLAFRLPAQTVTNVIDAFNTNTYPNGTITNKWSNWFGSAFQSLSLDPAVDANTNATSGALKITLNFPGTAGEQFEVWNGITGISPTVSGVQFTNFQCDVRFAAGSATSGGNFGNLQFGLATPSYGQDYYSTSVTIPASNTNWVHVSISLNVNTDTNLYNIANVLVHLYDGAGGLSGPSTLWVDNIRFVGMATNSGTVTVNYTNTQQRIDGFGASSAWMFSALSTADADLLFSTNTGAGLSFLRTRIAPGGVIDDAEGTIAQQAVARGARVWSTPWTPPVALKITNSWGTNAPLNGGWFSNTVANCQTYAGELTSYVAAMKNNYGVSLYAVSVQNEPTEFVNYESCEWTSLAIHDFVSCLSAALTASNFAATKIILPEHDSWSWNLATNTMSDATTSNLVGILACHNYGSTASAVTQFGTPCPKPIWETEHYLGTDDSITNGLAVAQEIHSFMTVAQASAYHYWWLTGSGTGSIANNTANPAKRLFVLGNYSKFVRPNFFRVGATNNSTALVSAYKDSASSNFVIVAANPSAYAVNQTFVLTNFPTMGTLTQWVTSASLSLSNQGPVSVAGNTFTYLLPAWTVVSFNFIQPVTNAPSIIQPPQNLASVTGGNATFTVTASGTGTLFYQWFFNATNSLPGATNASLTLTGLNATNAGNYSVVVTNFVGSVTSAVAVLTISTNASFVLSATDNVGGSSFNAIGNWTNSATGAAATFAPTSGYTYATGPFMLRTPSSAGNYTFAGDTLTVSAGGQINLKGGSGNIITFNNLILNGTISDAINPNSIASIAGNMLVLGGALNVSGASGDNRAITNYMTMSGSGALTNYGLGYVVYAGNNSAFTGPLIITNTTLLAAAQNNLGGNPASFNAAQLVLDNGTFQPTASLTLNNSNSGVTINANGGTFSVPAGVTLTVSNRLAGSGSLVKSGAGTLVLAATNNFTGALTISNGLIALTGNFPAKTAALDVRAGSTLDLSGQNGAFSVGNRITLAGNLVLGVMGGAASPALTASNLVFGGTLTVTNLGSAFVAGNVLPLFAATNYSGAFTAIVPAVPGHNLVWNTNQLAVNGTLAVSPLTGPLITAVQFANGGLIFNGTNGGANGSPFYILGSSDITLPLVNWTVIATNFFSAGGSFNVTNPINSSVPQSFYILQLP